MIWIKTHSSELRVQESAKWIAQIKIHNHCWESFTWGIIIMDHIFCAYRKFASSLWPYHLHAILNTLPKFTSHDVYNNASSNFVTSYTRCLWWIIWAPLKYLAYEAQTLPERTPYVNVIRSVKTGHNRKFFEFLLINCMPM